MKFKSLILFFVFASATFAQEENKLEEVTVESTIKDNKYAEEGPASALKGNLPLLKAPQSVQVINRNLMDDIGSNRLGDLLNYTSGIKAKSNPYGYDRQNIRGFNSSRFYQDGLYGENDIFEELYGIEQIEFIKGPASALYGKAAISGLLYLKSKRPQPKNFAEIRLTAGKWGFFEQAGDFGLVNASKNLYFRLIALNRNQKSFINTAESQRQYIAPSLTWDIKKNTNLTLFSRYRQDKFTFVPTLPAKGTITPNPNGKIPLSTYLGNKNTNDCDAYSAQIGYQFSHAFSKAIVLKQNFRYARVYKDRNNFRKISKILKDNETVFLKGWSTKKRQNRYYADAAMNFSFQGLGAKHTLITGLDYGHADTEVHSKNSKKLPKNIESINDVDNTTYAHTNLYKPQNGSYSLTYNDWEKTFIPFVNEETGVYIQESAKFGDLTATLAGRYTKHWKIPYEVGKNKKPITSVYSSFSPNLALSYQFYKGFAVYSSYAEAFITQADKLDKNGKSIAPEQSTNIEVGLKTNAFNKKLSSTLVVYQLTKSNVALKDVSDESFYTNAGKHRSRGVELNTSISLVSGLNSIFSYTFIKNKIIKGEKDKTGKTVPGQPEHAIASWIKYTFQSGLLENLGLAIGGRYFTEQYGDSNNTFKLPAYGVIDGSISYTYGYLKGQINFYNLENKRYFPYASSKLDVHQGAPFNIRGSITAKF